MEEYASLSVALALGLLASTVRLALFATRPQPPSSLPARLAIQMPAAKAAKSAVPESVLKKRKRQEKWDEENRAKAAAARVGVHREPCAWVRRGERK